MKKQTQLIVTLACLIPAVFENSINLDCKIYADFNVVLENFSDTSAIIKSVASQGRRECVLECLSARSCRAVNFKKATGTCELVGKSLTSNVLQRAGWTYLTTNNHSRKHGPNCVILSPCMNNGQCFDTCTDPGFKCICDNMHMGKHCEQVREFASCKEAYENGFSTSGVYKLTGMGYHYCVMTSLGECSGAGWTLIMKTKGGLATFAYAANYWTTANTYNHVYALNEGINIGEEAKFEAYNKLAFTKVCLGFDVSGTRKYLQIGKTASSMLTVMNSGHEATSLGRAKWLGVVQGSVLLANCNSEGFNVVTNVRIGIATNNENDCASPDSFIGIGLGANAGWCGMTATGTGNQECHSRTEIKAGGFILVQ